jgi:hypothetical protein
MFCSGGVVHQFLSALRAVPCVWTGDAGLTLWAFLEQPRAIVRAELFSAAARYRSGALGADSKLNGAPAVFDAHLDLLGAVCLKAGESVVRFWALFARVCLGQCFCVAVSGSTGPDDPGMAVKDQIRCCNLVVTGLNR